MSKQFSISILLLLLPFFLWADHYPINKNIDVLHYSFELILSDSANQIKGKTQVKVRFDKEGIAHFSSSTLMMNFSYSLPSLHQ